MKVFIYNKRINVSKYLLFFIVLSIIQSTDLQGQTLGFKWSTSLYGSGDDKSFAVIHPSGNFYYIIGSTESMDHDYPADSVDDKRIFLAKITLDGQKESVKLIHGFPLDSTVHPQKMIVASDGTFIVAGSIKQNGFGSSYDKDLILFAIDSFANLLWYKYYGGSKDDEGYDVIEIADGYLIASYSNSNNGDVGQNFGENDAWIIKTDWSGDLMWSKVFGGNGYDYAVSLLSNGNDLFILSTYGSIETGSLGEDDIVLFKINSTGDLLLKKHYGGSNNDRAVKLLQNSSNNLVIAGMSSSTNGNISGNHQYGTYDYTLIELDNSYSVINANCFGGVKSESLFDAVFHQNTYYLFGIADTSDGDIGLNYGNSDFWICAADSAFNLTGSFVFGGSNSDNGGNEGKSSLAIGDDGIFFSGSTRSTNGTVFSPIYGAENVYYGNIKFCNNAPQIATSFPPGDNVFCYGDTVLLAETGCPGCIHVWSDNQLNFDTAASILTSGGHNYYVKVIGECEAVAGKFDMFSTLPSYYVDKIEYSTNQYGYFNEVVKLNDSSLLGIGNGDNFYLASLTHGTLNWEKTYGGSTWEDASAILVSDDKKSYYMCGFTYSPDGDITNNHGSSDGWIIKTDASGNLLQSKCFGGSLHDELNDLKLINPNRFIACGTANSADGDLPMNYGNEDFWVMMLDSNLNIIWSKNLGGSLFDSGSNISVINSNRIAICGHSNSNDFDVLENKGGYDIWIMMIDTIGNIVWSKTLGTTLSDYQYSPGTLANKDGQIFLCSEVMGSDGDFPSQYNQSNVWLLSFDTLGNITWKKEFSGNSSERFCDISLNKNGDVMLMLQSFSNDGLVSVPTDFIGGWIFFKVNSSGDVLEQKFLQSDSYSNYQENYFGLSEIVAYGEDTLIVAGGTLVESMDEWNYLIQYINMSDPGIKILSFQDTSCVENSVELSVETCNGCSILWSNGETSQKTTVIAPGNYSVTVSFILPCYSFTDSISLMGGTLTPPPFITQQNDTLFSSYSTNNQWYINAVAIAGATESFIPITDLGCYQVAYTDSLGCEVFSDTLCIFSTQIENIQQPSLAVYPNPFESVINITGMYWKDITQIQLKDVLGRTLKSERLQSNSSNFNINWNLQQFPAGIYFIEAKGNQANNTVCLIKNQAFR